MVPNGGRKYRAAGGLVGQIRPKLRTGSPTLNSQETPERSDIPDDFIVDVFDGFQAFHPSAVVSTGKQVLQGSSLSMCIRVEGNLMTSP
jgi:hypothetical protein